MQSRDASWDSCPDRTASSPILAIVPLIIRRLRRASPVRVIAVPPVYPVVSSRSPARVALPRTENLPGRVRLPRRSSGLVCVPPRAFATVDRDAVALCRQWQSRVSAGLSAGAPATPTPGRWVVLPRAFINSRRTNALPLRVMRPRRCFSPLESSPGHQPEIRHQRVATETAKVVQLGKDQEGDQELLKARSDSAAQGGERPVAGTVLPLPPGERCET